MIEYIGMCGFGVLVLVGVFFLQRYTEHRALRTRLERLARTRCPSCGVPYGMEMALRTERERQEMWKGAREQGMYLRLLPFWEVRCDHCGAENLYDPRKLVLDTEVVVSRETAGAEAFLEELQRRLEEWRNAPVEAGTPRSSEEEQQR